VAQSLECAAARSLSGLANLAGFCRDSGGIRDKAPNSGSYTPLAPRVNHITNINDDGTIPAVADQNWLTYNNFRSGGLSAADGLSAPDLQLRSPETCKNVCAGADALEVWVQLGNVGAVPLTGGAKIEVYGTSKGMETLLKTAEFLDILAPGEFADALIIPVDTAGVETLRLVAVSKETECKVDADNEVVLTQPFCEAPT